MIGIINIGKKLKELRQEKKLTQQQLATKIGIERVNYCRYESGSVRPDFETLISLADFFEITLDEIFGRHKNKPVKQ